MVQLKVTNLIINNHPSPYFNSSVVQLKAKDGGGLEQVKGKFQFLSGTIKSTNKGAIASVKLLFQFLSGTIKRKLKWLTLLITIDFNSSVVQLKAGIIVAQDILCNISIPQWYN